ncbi:ATP-binding protein [Nostoc sp. FACHB-152]|uniref:sacsin N-terminal ATP-binding-like domain-containing protein n=1 Tax=Nostoc sp. FACHB-152 TaxID=2692837 RepID=UPI0016870F64|nr:ATP-binding protein [Nostoc sp. FACHB-152]MBD2452468.1 ATP-binding protein [Nostoc sp. FACHB-152]
MLSPKQIIEDISKNRYGIGLKTEKAAQEAMNHLRRSLNSALERLSVDLYSKETHFVLELIQNADDNQYKKEIIPTLILTIDSQKIVVKNNETGFTEENVRAICNVGASTKTKVKGYIGEKGIGFKSVFRISDEPQIFSNGFQFKFQHQNDKDQLGFVVPSWIETVPRYIDLNGSPRLDMIN